MQNGDQQSTLAATAAATVQNSVQNSDPQLTWAATAAANQQPVVSQVTIPAQEQLSLPAQQPVLQQRKPELRSRIPVPQVSLKQTQATPVTPAFRLTSRGKAAHASPDEEGFVRASGKHTFAPRILTSMRHPQSPAAVNNMIRDRRLSC